MGRAKVPGSITFFFLVMMVLAGSVGTILLKIQVQRVKSKEISRVARQQSVLFHSASKVLQNETFLRKGEKQQLPPVSFSPQGAAVVLKRQGLGRRRSEYLCEEESLELWQGEYQPMAAVRIQMEMPGALNGKVISGIWDATTDGVKPRVDFGEFPQLSWSPFPDTERLKAPLAGYLFYETVKKPVRWTNQEHIRGHGILVIPSSLIIGAGCKIEGDFRIFVAGAVKVEEQAILDKVYMYSAKDINISKSSHLTGILAAKGRVQLEEGAVFVPDASVLEPYQTPFIF